MKYYLVALLFIIPASIQAQRTLPYYEITDYPDTYTATTVTARMIDGLGFRIYWATEGLRAEDLNFKPSEEARTSEETVNHILGLVDVVLNSVKQQPSTGMALEELTFEEKRTLTLNKLKEASDLLKSNPDGSMEDYNIILQSSTSTREYPFWNQLNGPLSDAIWHVGQVVTFRRSSGNPISSKVNFLTGTVRE